MARVFADRTNHHAESCRCGSSLPPSPSADRASKNRKAPRSSHQSHLKSPRIPLPTRLHRASHHGNPPPRAILASQLGGFFCPRLSLAFLFSPLAISRTPRDLDPIYEFHNAPEIPPWRRGKAKKPIHRLPAATPDLPPPTGAPVPRNLETVHRTASSSILAIASRTFDRRAAKLATRLHTHHPQRVSCIDKHALSRLHSVVAPR